MGFLRKVGKKIKKGLKKVFGGKFGKIIGGRPITANWLINQPSTAVESFQPSGDPEDQLSTVQDVNQDGVIDVLDMIMSQMKNN